MDSCCHGHKTQCMGNKGDHRSGGEAGSLAQFGSEAVRKDPASRRASRVESALETRGDMGLHGSGGLLWNVGGASGLDQFRPDQMPVSGAQVPATDGKVAESLDQHGQFGAGFARPIVCHLPCGELVQVHRADAERLRKGRNAPVRQ